MSVVFLGLQKVSAALGAPIAIVSDELPLVLERIAKSDHVTEVVVLSTCLRTEVYVDALRYHGAVHDIRVALGQFSDLDISQISESIVDLHDEAAVAHLFRVSSGLDSEVLGEPEILGQVARSWETARQLGYAKAILNNLFRRAVEVGKRARTETGISQGTVSVGQAAADLLAHNVEQIDAKRVLIIGAGDVGSSVAAALHKHNKNSIVVANRSVEKAQALARRVGGEAISMSDAAEELRFADVVVVATSATGPVVSMQALQRRRAESAAPLTVLNLSTHSNLETDLCNLDDVTVLDLQDVNERTDLSRSRRASHVDGVEEIIQFETRNYFADVSARSVAPVLAALRARLQEQTIIELRRHLSDTEDVARLAASVVAKIMHEPTVHLKALGGTPEAELMTQTLRQLFNI